MRYFFVLLIFLLCSFGLTFSVLLSTPTDGCAGGGGRSVRRLVVQQHGWPKSAEAFAGPVPAMDRTSTPPRRAPPLGRSRAPRTRKLNVMGIAGERVVLDNTTSVGEQVFGSFEVRRGLAGLPALGLAWQACAALWGSQPLGSPRPWCATVADLAGPLRLRPRPPAQDSVLQLFTVMMGDMQYDTLKNILNLDTVAARLAVTLAGGAPGGLGRGSKHLVAWCKARTPSLHRSH